MQHQSRQNSNVSLRDPLCFVALAGLRCAAADHVAGRDPQCAQSRGVREWASTVERRVRGISAHRAHRESTARDSWHSERGWVSTARSFEAFPPCCYNTIALSNDSVYHHSVTGVQLHSARRKGTIQHACPSPVLLSAPSPSVPEAE